MEPSPLKAFKKLSKHLWGTDEVCWSCLGAGRWTTWFLEVLSNPIFNISFLRQCITCCRTSLLAELHSFLYFSFWDLQSSQKQSQSPSSLKGIAVVTPCGSLHSVWSRATGVDSSLSLTWKGWEKQTQPVLTLTHSQPRHLESSRPKDTQVIILYFFREGKKWLTLISYSTCDHGRIPLLCISAMQKLFELHHQETKNTQIWFAWCLWVKDTKPPQNHPGTACRIVSDPENM